MRKGRGRRRLGEDDDGTTVCLGARLVPTERGLARGESYRFGKARRGAATRIGILCAFLGAAVFFFVLFRLIGVAVSKAFYHDDDILYQAIVLYGQSTSRLQILHLSKTHLQQL